MPTFQHTPGCPCCTCLLYRTAFSDSSVLDDWTVTDSADGSIVSGELQLTDSGTTAVYDTAHPQSPYPPRVSAKVKGATGAELRVLLSWGGSYGLVAELRPDDGCGEVELFQVSGGVESSLGSWGVPGLTASAWHQVFVCYDPRTGTLTARVTTADGRYGEFTAIVTGHTDAPYAGLATGPTHLGTAYFDDFKWERLWYYGDGVQDDYDQYTVVTECSQCGPGGRCAWIDADFSDADRICEWSGDTSDWATGSDLLGYTPGSFALILHETAYPWDDRTEPLTGTYYGDRSATATTSKQFDVDHNQRHQLTLTFTAAASSVVHAIVAAADEDNYLAAVLTPGDFSSGARCGTLQLVSVSAGVSTDLGPEHVVRGLNTSNEITVNLSYHDGVLVADIRIDDATIPAIQVRESASYSGGYVGVAASGGVVNVSEFQAGCRFINEDCTLDGDLFGWDSSSWVTCPWSKLSGTWPTRDNAGGLYWLDVAADVELLHQNPVPEYYRSAHRATLTGTVDNVSGAKFALLFGCDDDASDGYKLELEVGATNSTLTLYKIEASVETSLDSATVTTPTAVFTLTGCVTDGTIYGGLSGGTTLDYSTTTTYGLYAGLAIDLAATGDATVTAFSTTRIHAGLNSWDDTFVTLCQSCLPGEDCEECDGGEMAGAYQLTTVGIGAGQCASAFCTAANQTAVAPSTGETPIGCNAGVLVDLDPQPTCTLLLFGSTATVTLDNVGLSVYFSDSGGDLQIDGYCEVNKTGLIGTLIIQYHFRATFAKPYDCQSMYLVELPLYEVTTYNIACSGGTADCPCSPSPADDVADFPDVKMYVSSL